MGGKEFPQRWAREGIPAPAAAAGDRVAELDRWRAQHRFYHSQIAQYLQFAIAGGESVLLLGCEDGALLSALGAARGLGVDRCPQLIGAARRRHPGFEFVAAADYAVDTDDRFDCVVLNDITGAADDLFTLLGRVRRMCRDDGRVVIVQHNYLWRPALRLAAAMGLKRPDATPNLLSAGDLRVLLGGAGFDVTDVRAKLFCPLGMLGLGRAINWVAGLIPLINRLACVEIVVARPVFALCDDARRRKTATVVLTVRDERENIEPMVRALPAVGAETEIVFVEGHSTDGTREEIERV
ncbi:MAG: methyltransferase domain-containing protein, partial [Phycisphaerales bacterium]|nr:methyltransferase domain-containing protein [Phycisphaerales bacterium]